MLRQQRMRAQMQSSVAPWLPAWSLQHEAYPLHVGVGCSARGSLVLLLTFLAARCPLMAVSSSTMRFGVRPLRPGTNEQSRQASAAFPTCSVIGILFAHIISRSSDTSRNQPCPVASRVPFINPLKTRDPAIEAHDSWPVHKRRQLIC